MSRFDFRSWTRTLKLVCFVLLLEVHRVRLWWAVWDCLCRELKFEEVSDPASLSQESVPGAAAASGSSDVKAGGDAAPTGTGGAASRQWEGQMKVGELQQETLSTLEAMILECCMLSFERHMMSLHWEWNCVHMMSKKFRAAD